MSEAVLLLTRAYEFATRKHTLQRRKGVAAEPYINHLAEVAELLAAATGGGDIGLVIAGVLHDTIEDTATTHAELEAGFGADIAALVAEVTDDRTLPKATRKRLQVDLAAKKSTRARMIKLADKTSNLRAVLASPPADWTRERKREYFEWAQAVAAGCRGVNAALETLFDHAYVSGIKTLD
jgi:(p)ppGpp synthase/HD superfamily hydrolase